MKKIFIIFLIIVGIAIIFNSIRDSSWLPFVSEKTETEVSDRVEQIELDIAGAAVEIITENRKTVKAELDGKGKVSVDRSRNTITVDYEQQWFRIFPFFNTTEVKVYIPEDYHKDMHVDMGSANLTFIGDSKDRPAKLNELSLDLSSGNVKLENLAVSRFSHDGSSGNVTANEFSAEKGSFDISSGRIILKEYTGEIKAELSSGKFDAELKEVAAPIDVSVSSGSVSLDLPEDSDFTLNSKVSSGNISYDFPMEVLKQDGRKFEGMYGKGTHEINIELSSGTAKIK